MNTIIKSEEEDYTFIGKVEDDNNLKCGEIVFSNSTRFCFSCVFCNRVCSKIQEFFRHVLYDHLNYLDEYQFSDEDEHSAQKILEPKNTKLPPMCDTEFIDVDLEFNSTKIDKFNFGKHFENFVCDETLTSYVKTEIEEYEEDIESGLQSDCENPLQAKLSSTPIPRSSSQDILQIEILEEPAPYSNENTSEQLSQNYDNEENHDDDDHKDISQFDSGAEESNSANKDENTTKEEVYNCPHCKKVFVTKLGVKRHISNVHSGKPNKLTCDKCSKTFKTSAQLELHVKRHMGVKPHPCEICGTCFSDKSNLNVHILRHKGIKPHECLLCEKRFHSTTERKLHMRSHTGERPFVCEVCGRKFSNSGHLCSHRRRHFGEKRFECDHCQKRFFDRKLLNDHKVMHTDERPFACDSCGATFQRKKALLQHEKLHSSVRQYVCKICGKSFAQNAGLYSHMKYH